MPIALNLLGLGLSPSCLAPLLRALFWTGSSVSFTTVLLVSGRVSFSPSPSASVVFWVNVYPHDSNLRCAAMFFKRRKHDSNKHLNNLSLRTSQVIIQNISSLAIHWSDRGNPISPKWMASLCCSVAPYFFREGYSHCAGALQTVSSATHFEVQHQSIANYG